MELRNLQIENFLSIRKIDINLEDRGLTLVSGHSEDEGGENGAGKSSLARNSIAWCLYGKTASGTKGDQLVNRHTKQTASVSLSFHIGDILYRIVRTQQPNSLKLYANSQDISDKTNAQTQNKLENILGKSFDLFLHCDVLGQGKNKTFLDETPSQQRNIIEEILPLEQVNIWLANTVLAETKSSAKLSELQNKKSNIQGQIAGIENSYNQIKNYFVEWETERLNKGKDLQKNLDQLTGLVQEKENQIQELKNKIKNYSNNIDIEELESLIKSRTEDKSNFLSEKGIISSDLARLEKRKGAIESLGDVCDSCEQKISPLQKASTIHQIDVEIKLLNEKYKKIDTLLSHCERELTQFETKRLKIKADSNKVKEFENKINQLKLSIAQEDNRDKLLKDISALNNLSNPHKDSLDRLKTELEEKEKEYKEVSFEVSEATEEQGLIKFWKKAFGKDIPALLFEQACPFLEERANYYLGLLNNSQISVGINTSKELKSGDTRRDFNVIVKSLTGGGDYNLLSGGEQQIVNFAMSLALSDLAETQVTNSSRFVILDEPFMSLDRRNSESIVAFLTSYLSQKKNLILLISNEPTLQDLIPNRIKVLKKDGITTLSNVAN